MRLGEDGTFTLDEIVIYGDAPGGSLSDDEKQALDKANANSPADSNSDPAQIPAGLKPMRNPCPAGISKFAHDVVFTPSVYPMGSTNKCPPELCNGRNIYGRVEWHTWSHDKTGKLITGLFRGCTMYEIV